MLKASFDVLVSGIGVHDGIVTMIRVALGVFFWSSGSWKSFREQSHDNLYQEMVARHIPYPRANAWFVASVEMFAGMALVAGFLTTIAALGLFAICMVACVTGEHPAGSLWDRIGDYLWKQDVLLALLLLVIIAAGSGPYSSDRVVAEWLAVPTSTQFATR